MKDQIGNKSFNPTKEDNFLEKDQFYLARDD